VAASVSVALCTHNGAVYIEQQLRSVLDQSVKPSEIIISDDASTDGTLDIIAGIVAIWKADHPDASVRVEVLRNEVALGVTANFEQALAACTGDLIALCDQDDIWHPNRLERMRSQFDHLPDLLLLHSDARIVDGAGVPTGESLLQTLYVSPAEITAVHAGRAIDVLIRRNIVTGATAMLRRALVNRSRPFPPSWVHDEWLAVVGAATGGVDLLEEQITDYRQHGGNQIGASSLDAAGKLGRLRAPRSARNARLLARATALQERAKTFTPVPTDAILSMIDGKLAHERARSELSPNRIRRIIPVLRQWRTGSYDRYGLGLPDVLRDLVQPV
jgi:hypothetical protein